MSTIVNQIGAEASGLATWLTQRFAGLDPDLAAKGIAMTLDKMRPGTSAKVAAWTKAYQGGGVPAKQAFHQALTQAIDGMVWEMAQGAPAMNGCCGGMGDYSGVADLINAIGTGIQSASDLAFGIVSQVQSAKDRRNDRNSAGGAAQAAISQAQGGTSSGVGVPMMYQPPVSSGGIPAWGWAAGAGVLGLGALFLLKKK